MKISASLTSCLLNHRKIYIHQPSAHKDISHYLHSNKSCYSACISFLFLLFPLLSNFSFGLCSVRREEEPTGPSSNNPTKRRKMREEGENENLKIRCEELYPAEQRYQITSRLILRSTTKHITVIPSLQSCSITINITAYAADALWTFTSDTEDIFSRGLLRQ